MYVDDLDAMAADALKRGRVPPRRVATYQGVFGAGAPCPVCGERVTADTLAADLLTREGELVLHIPCFMAWQQRLEDREEARRAALPTDDGATPRAPGAGLSPAGQPRTT